MTRSLEECLEIIYKAHDIEANQKYAKEHPYSFHLKEENDKDILGFDDFNDLMKCHETQRALLVVINLLKKKLPSLPNPKPTTK